jgi:hypothetical protein
MKLEKRLLVLLPDALITTVSFHFDAIPMVMSIENNEANGNAYKITLGVCRRRYRTIK